MGKKKTKNMKLKQEEFVNNALPPYRTSTNIMILEAIQAFRNLDKQLVSEGYPNIDGLFIRVDVMVEGKIIPMAMKMGQMINLEISMTAPQDIPNADYDYKSMVSYADVDQQLLAHDANTEDHLFANQSNETVPRSKRLSQEEKSQIILLYNQGASISSICETLNRSRNAVRSVIYKYDRNRQK